MANAIDAVTVAIRHFWKTRARQSARQGSAGGQRDQGARRTVTGGKQMDGFVGLVRDIIVEAGIPHESIFVKQRLELPGYFRPEKKWDLLVVDDGNLLAAVEFKSQVGPSFGNNFNNRAEEAIGNAQDIWTAFREGAFDASQRPWLGYLILLEDADGSTSPVSIREPHFGVFPEFRDSSYASRYATLMKKLIRERLYDSACFLMSDRAEGRKGSYTEPLADLGVEQFCGSLQGRIIGYRKTS